MQDSILVALKALQNSQEFYSSAFGKIQESYNIFIALCCGILAVAAIVVTIASIRNKKLENTDKELKEKFDAQKENLIALLKEKQKELDALYQNKETESMKECKTVRNELKLFERKFDTFFPAIIAKKNEDSQQENSSNH